MTLAAYRLPLLLLPLLGLGGCDSLLREGSGDLAGLGGAALASAVTDNGAVTAGIGLGVQSAARTGLQYLQRRIHQAEQDSIAATAGALEPGQVGQWSIRHAVAIEDDQHGQVVVTREIGEAALQCREIIFSVVTDPPAAKTVEAADPSVMPPPPPPPAAKPETDFYTAAICRHGGRWKWALAEPATERWGSLQ